jgi:hypothetical protein
MGKFDQIVESAWADAELFAESVPHVLHQDLAYLWILEKDARQRPNSWRARIEAWRHLVALFLSGEVTTQMVAFPEQPLLSYARPYGIENVTFLHLPRSAPSKMPEAVGVLSSTVLVRPLPDFTPEWLPEMRLAAEQKARPEDVNHFLHLALQQLAAAAGSDYAQRLSRILQREFSPAAAPHPANGVAVSVPALRRLEWAQRGSTAPDESMKVVGALPILVRAQEPARRTFMPRCEACNLPLARAQNDPALSVESNLVQIPCLSTACGVANVVPLERFLIWNRDSSRVLVWEQEAEFVTFDMELPPRPQVQGIEVHFSWNAAQVQGDHVRRHLRLQFAGKSISIEKPSAVFFKKLLVPGRLEQFRGYPVRPEWTDAVDVTGVIPRTAADPLMVDFDGIQLHGWPTRIALRPRRFTIVTEPALGVGMFPSPTVVGPNWHWFRTFMTADSIASQHYRLSTEGARPLLPHVATSESGIPRAITVSSASDDNVGVTYYPRLVPVPALQRENSISVSIDFGTTNTVLYYKGPSHDSTEDFTPTANGIAPRDVAAAIHWFASDDSADTATEIAGFLPGPAYRRKVSDPFIFPSAVWELSHPGELVIRWSAAPPVPDATPLAKFKWDPPTETGHGYEPQRRAYLIEILLMSLAAIAKKDSRARNAILGTAFPLAFDHRERTRYMGTLRDVSSEIHRLTGIEVTEVYSISESSACVEAFGQFNPGDTFLVADMGGGTLDLALFTFNSARSRREETHQIGSIRYAGESFITALAQRQGDDGARASDATTWRIRDSILAETSHTDYGTQQSTEEILRRFTTLAFEYLRTMIAAFRTVRDADTKVNLVLVGNGWNLISAFSSRRAKDGDDRIVRETYDHIVSLLGEPNVAIYRPQSHDDSEQLLTNRYSKHLVAVGALKNTRTPQRKELEREAEYGRLPAGRGVTFAQRHLTWSDLVGAGVAFDQMDAHDIHRDSIEFNLMTMAPLKNTSWRRRLLDSLGADDEAHIPYPDAAKLREQTRLSVAGDPPKVERGPLQLILEQFWSRRLSARGRQ